MPSPRRQLSHVRTLAVDQVVICTPDKDLAQCVVGQRVVQLDRRKEVVTDEDAVRERYGISPASIPDWLALVGDSADGFPGLAGWGRRSASLVLAHYGHIEAIPDEIADWDKKVIGSVRGAPSLAATLASQRAAAMLFRVLATLRIDRSLLSDVDQLAWRGPTPAFGDICRYLRDEPLSARMAALAGALSSPRSRLGRPGRAPRALRFRAGRSCTRQASALAASGGRRWRGGTGRLEDGRRQPRTRARG